MSAAKTIPGPRLVRMQTAGQDVRGRDTEVAREPVRVSEHAQARPLDLEAIRQFNFDQPGPTVLTALPERPSTSGGPGTTSNFSIRRNAEKRETRDDLYFGVTSEKTTIFYDFPLPGGLPTPTRSSRDSSLPPRQSSLPRSLTPDSVDMPRLQSIQQMDIGMALGSPTQQTGQTKTLLCRGATPDTFQDLSADEPVLQAPAKSKSKWKMFGGLFGGNKKSTSQGHAFYQLQAGGSNREGESGQHHDEQSTALPTGGRGRTNSERKIGRHKPDVKRSNTAPYLSEPDSSRTHGKNVYPEILLDGHQLDEAIHRSNGGLLNVEIPSIEMERYSVMFGSLLGNQPNSSSSLLTRRQATLDRLKTANEELELKERELEEKTKHVKQPRRATSPQPTRSPAFSLFPNTPSRDIRTNRTPSPNGRHVTLHRSNTSPAALSPSRPTFAPGPDNETHATLLEPAISTPRDFASEYQGAVFRKASQRKGNENSTSVAKASKAPMERAISTFTPDQSFFTSSPDSDTFESSYVPMKPKLVEPTWEVIPNIAATKRSESVTGSTTSQSEHSKSASGSSTSTSTSNTPYSASTTRNIATSSSLNKQDNVKSLKISGHKLNHTSPQQAHSTRTRTRSATTSSPSPNAVPRPFIHSPNLSEISDSSVALSAIIPAPIDQPPTSLNTFSRGQISKSDDRLQRDQEHEEHLKSLADVSIARQISVSRQQRQLLIPIKGSIRGRSPSNIRPSRAATTPTSTDISPLVSSTPSISISPASHNHNFPSPNQNRTRTPVVNVNREASPLSAVKKATKVEQLSLDREQGREREGSIVGMSKVPGIIIKGTEKRERRDREERERERLVQVVKPSTPTLVIVPSPAAEVEESNWDGNVQIFAPVIDATQGNGAEKSGIAERRRRAREVALARGDISARKSKGREDERGLTADARLGSAEERRRHEHRKSERAVVERI